jgi:prophage regulatory protein
MNVLDGPDALGVRERTPVDEELRSLKVVMAKTGLSRSTLYAYIAAGAFPTQWRLGKRRVAWFASEVRNWITSRPAVGMGTAERTARE